MPTHSAILTPTPLAIATIGRLLLLHPLVLLAMPVLIGLTVRRTT